MYELSFTQGLDIDGILTCSSSYYLSPDLVPRTARVPRYYLGVSPEQHVRMLSPDIIWTMHVFLFEKTSSPTGEHLIDAICLPPRTSG